MPELTKKERRDKRQAEKLHRIEEELQSSLSSFRSTMHEMFKEWEEKGTTFGGREDLITLSQEERHAIASKSPGKRIKPFIQGVVTEPLEPIKLQKGVKLTIKDGEPFKEPIGSPKMQKNLRVLELRLDTKGHLFSPKAFDPEWNWQTQAIWLRTIGIGYLEISKRVSMSLDTVKSMFKRLKLTKFFSRTSKLDYPTIGYKGVNTPSGWRAIKKGGTSDMQYLPSEMVVNPETGLLEPLYKVNFNVGEHVIIDSSTEYKVQTRPFKLEKHKKEVKKREKEVGKRKKEVILEQKTIEIENLQKNIEKGFNPKTKKYKKEVNK